MEHSEASAAPMRGKIKWFNAEKGYGFVKPDDGSSDVFLHVTALKRANIEAAPEGASIVFEMVQSQKGRQVGSVIELDPATATPPAGPAHQR